MPFRLPPELALSDDLTQRARRGDLSGDVPFEGEGKIARVIDAMVQALHRRCANHVLLTGERGVGKGAIVAGLARRGAMTDVPFLADKQFLLVDARYVPPVESGPRLAGILQHVAAHENSVLCIEGLPALCCRQQGVDHRLFLLSVLSRVQLQVIGLVTPHEYDELTSDLPEMQEFFQRVDVEEPDVPLALKLVNHYAAGLRESFDTQIDDEAVRQSVLLSAHYILNEHLPSKALRVLSRCCENMDYEREMMGNGQGHGAMQGRGEQRNADETQPASPYPHDDEPTEWRVTTEDVLAEVSRVSGVPEETLRGISEKNDYVQSLKEQIVGQDDAVAAMATELNLIKAGMTDPDKPASVVLFVGQTGTGKTELAKALARFYSTSKRLQTYTMGNFVEPHSVSGIIGVPPGYVGHDLGGRLINELNADPYCVFLLDEADKAHPDVLQPFLNLFDEGWVRDQRGVKAFGEKAIFILTTNVAQKMIGDMARRGDPPEEIAEKTKASLSRIRHPSANRPVFSPEFLARIKRVIVFQPLDQAAMEGICRKMIREMQQLWRTKRDRTLEVPEALVLHIAEESYQRNEKSAGREGGRIVRRMLSDLVEANVQKAITERPDEYRACKVVHVECEMVDTEAEDQPPPRPEIRVNFLRDERGEETTSAVAATAIKS